uniref:RING-type domain-containing protein n=1 Tax=Ditylenchus dipsaci TaxID=166011 RepID=A0A915DQJ9_9BILA
MEEHLKLIFADLECAMCMSTLNNVRSLPCGHMFCGTCVDSLLNTAPLDISQMVSIQCPSCRATAVISRHDANVNNHHYHQMNGIISKLSQAKTLWKTSPKCSYCSTVTLAHKLITCTSCVSKPSLCADCVLDQDHINHVRVKTIDLATPEFIQSAVENMQQLKKDCTKVLTDFTIKVNHLTQTEEKNKICSILMPK